ncbi:hypothetical protein SUDANB25_00030 [Streptomyces sp. SudanB25_2051]
MKGYRLRYTLATQQFTRDHHRIKHLDPALTQQPLHGSHPAVPCQERPAPVDRAVRRVS